MKKRLTAIYGMHGLSDFGGIRRSHEFFYGNDNAAQ
jgi:hypothetical protein